MERATEGVFGPRRDKVLSVLQAEAASNTDTTPTEPHRNSNTHRTKNNTTNVVIQQNSHKLLIMDILMSETCWTHKKWNKIASDIKLVFYSSTITMTHGPINIRSMWYLNLYHFQDSRLSTAKTIYGARTASCSKRAREIFLRDKSGQEVQLSTHLHLVPNLRISWAVVPFPPYTFQVCVRKILYIIFVPGFKTSPQWICWSLDLR